MSYHFICCLFLVSILFSCGQSAKPKPDEVVKLFIDAMNTQDFKTARLHASKSTLQLIDFMEELAEKAKEQGIPFSETEPVESVTCEINGLTALCQFCCVDDRGESDIELLYENEQWLVHIDMSDLLPTGEHSDLFEEEGIEEN